MSTLGAVLSLFLARDGGPRTGAIQLPEKPDNYPATIEEEDEEESIMGDPEDGASPGPKGSLGRRLGKKISGYFGKGPGGTNSVPQSPTIAMPLAVPVPRTRAYSAGGAAYGYSATTRARLASISAASVQRGGIATSLARRRASMAAGDASAMGVAPGTSFGASAARPSFAGSTADLTFAQRLLLANENAVTSIADLWVASAMNVDNEEVFESDPEDEDELNEGHEEANASRFTAMSSTSAANMSVPGNSARTGRRGSTASTVRQGLRRGTNQSLGPEELAARRAAAAMPAIFHNAGLQTPPALMDTPSMQPMALLPESASSALDTTMGDMATIPESRPLSTVQFGEDVAAEEPVVDEKGRSMWQDLPLAIIIQYGLIALHTTTHDQVFLSYLVSPYESGGLNLNPGHFAQLSMYNNHTCSTLSNKGL
jgi:hypothetical protein